MITVNSLKCPNCGGSIPDTSKACNFCGSRVILTRDRNKFVLAGIFCPKCGSDNKEQNRFCNKCGEKLFKACPACQNEIHFESIHCSFCGNNLDDAAKEKDKELAKNQERKKEKAHLGEMLELLYEKLKPLQEETSYLAHEAYKAFEPIDYSMSEERGFTKFQVFFIGMPLGSIILTGIIYLIGHDKGFSNSFLYPVFVLFWFGFFYFFHLMPTNKHKKLSKQLKIKIDERDKIFLEIQTINYQIASIDKEIIDVAHRYHLPEEVL